MRFELEKVKNDKDPYYRSSTIIVNEITEVDDLYKVNLEYKEIRKCFKDADKYIEGTLIIYEKHILYFDIQTIKEIRGSKAIVPVKNQMTNKSFEVRNAIGRDFKITSVEQVAFSEEILDECVEDSKYDNLFSNEDGTILVII